MPTPNPYFPWIAGTNTRALLLLRQGGNEHALFADLVNQNYDPQQATLSYGMTPLYGVASSFPNMYNLAAKASATPSPLLNSVPFEEATIFFDGCPTSVAPCYSAYQPNAMLCRSLCGGYSRQQMAHCWNKEQGCVPCEDLPCSRTTCGNNFWSGNSDYCSFLPGCALNK